MQRGPHLSDLLRDRSQEVRRVPEGLAQVTGPML